MSVERKYASLCETAVTGQVGSSRAELLFEREQMLKKVLVPMKMDNFWKRDFWRGKWYALRLLFCMTLWLSNWEEVWDSYRISGRLPSFRFRNGMVWNHGPLDSPLIMFREICVLRRHDQHVHKTDKGIMLDIG